ncbi:MAG: hypothetical protein MK142_02120 [Pseudomonadales bacterium]|nr:hypothetical protein [Pseudomonadales bacterium]
MNDAALNAHLAELVSADESTFDVIRDDRLHRWLMDRFDVDLSWSEGVWCAQIVGPDGIAREEEDVVAARAAGHVILAAHGVR